MWPLLLLSAACAYSQEALPARPSPEAYPRQAQLGDLVLAAEYQGHGINAAERPFATPDYIVIELAVFPKAGQTVKINPGQFTLRLNGKKSVLFPATPSMVAASLQYPNSEGYRGIEASGGIGNAGVILGGPGRSPRFPGDPGGAYPRVGVGMPGPAETPMNDAPEAVVRLGWADSEVARPAAGYLYFPYSGKLAKIKTMELLFQGESGQSSLLLKK